MKCPRHGYRLLVSTMAMELDCDAVTGPPDRIIAMWCIRCGPLSFGPANDTPEVLVEVRAATLAADHADILRAGPSAFTKQAWEKRHARASMSITEAAAWANCVPLDYTWSSGTDEDVDIQTGFLARAIAHHDDEQRATCESDLRTAASDFLDGMGEVVTP